MTVAQWAPIAWGVFSALLVPVIVLLIRGAVKWTRTEDQLATLITDVRELIQEKDKVHGEILQQMRVDRDATDRRLRYIEEWFMEYGRFLKGSAAS